MHILLARNEEKVQSMPSNFREAQAAELGPERSAPKSAPTHGKRV